MSSYQLLSAVISGLALGLFVTVAPLLRHRTTIWSSLVSALLIGLVLSTPFIFLGVYFFTGSFVLEGKLFQLFGFQRIDLPYLEVYIDVILFLSCFFGLPEVVARSSKIRSHFVKPLLISAFFCVAFSANYILFVTYVQQIIVLTIMEGAISGLAGAFIALLLARLKVSPVALLRRWISFLKHLTVNSFRIMYQRRWLLGRLFVVLGLVVIAILLPLYNDLDGILAYSINYQSEGNTITVPIISDNYLNLARYYQRMGDTNTAITLLEQSKANDPEFYSAYLQLADLIIENGQYQAAIENLDIAASLAPNDTTPYYGRAMAYEALEDYDAAIKNIDRVITLTPENSTAYLIRAGLYIQAGKYSEALADVMKVDELSLDAQNKSKTLLLKVMIYLGQNNRTKVEQTLAELLKETTLPFLPSMNLSWQVQASFDPEIRFLYTSGDTYTLYAYDSMIRTPDPAFADALKNRFDSSLSILEYLTPALENLAKSSSNFDALGIYRSLGILYASEGRHNTALDYYQKAVELAQKLNDVPSQIDILTKLAETANSLQETNMAHQAYEKSLALAMQHSILSDDLVEIYYRLGLLNFKNNQFESAIKNLSETLNLNPNHKDARFVRAQAYFNFSQTEEAIADIRYALQVDPNWIEAHLMLGYYLAFVGQLEEAIETLTAIEEKANNRPLYYHYLGYVYVRKGEHSLALTSYEDCFKLIGNQGGGNTALFEQIVGELRQLSQLDPATNGVIDDIWLIMRGAIASDDQTSLNLNNISSYSLSRPVNFFSAVTETITSTGVFAYNQAAVITPTLPVTQVFWVRVVTGGPKQISAGGSDIFEIAVELRDSRNSDGTEIPVELYRDHTHSIEARLDVLNFDVSSNTEANLVHPLEVRQPVRWRWILSPRQGYEGNQRIAYTLVVHDRDKTGWTQEISAGTVLITVPTHYGIPSQLLAPLSGAAAVLAILVILPLVKPFFNQRGQYVTYQYNAAGNINFAGAEDKVDVVVELEKLLTELDKAIEASIFDQELAVDVRYHLTKAIQQARKPTPNKVSVVDHLNQAKLLIGDVDVAADLVEALTDATKSVKKLF